MPGTAPARLPPPSRSATRSPSLAPPGPPPADVYEMSAHDSTEEFIEAVATADRILGLTALGTARLLTVVSDGHFTDRRAAQHHLTRLHGTGCRILWLAPDSRGLRPYRHTTTLVVDDPTACIRLVGASARAALRMA